MALATRAVLRFQVSRNYPGLADLALLAGAAYLIELAVSRQRAWCLPVAITSPQMATADSRNCSSISA